jgi:hypothetical protein
MSPITYVTRWPLVVSPSSRSDSNPTGPVGQSPHRPRRDRNDRRWHPGLGWSVPGAVEQRPISPVWSPDDRTGATERPNGYWDIIFQFC